MILGIDSATAWLSLALHDREQVIAETTYRTRNQHTEQLTPAIAHLFEQAGTTPQVLSAIAISQGPGSFSGLRAGFGVAKGLALALALPLIPIPTLDIIAAATPYHEQALIAVLQAGRGRIIAQRYTWGGTWQAHQEAAITTWAACLEGVSAPTFINGEIDDTGAALINAHPYASAFPLPWRLRRAGFLAQLAWEKIEAGDAADPATVNPLYLKEPG